MGIFWCHFLALLAIGISQVFCASHLLPERHGHGDLAVLNRATFRGRNLRILPLGASITAGRDSSTGNGYRKDLQDLLEGDGNNVTYVGTRFYGTMADNACEAYPGYTIERVDNATRESGALLFLPNVVLINLGTNNCVIKNQDPARAPEQYKQLLDHIRDVVPSALVMVSSLVHNRDPSKDACIVTLNAGLQRVANEARSFGQKIAFVDMYDAVPMGDIDKKDKTHPRDDGYAVMAKVWYDGIVESAGNITALSPNGRTPLMSPGPRGEGAMLRASAWPALLMVCLAITITAMKL